MTWPDLAVCALVAAVAAASVWAGWRLRAQWPAPVVHAPVMLRVSADETTAWVTIRFRAGSVAREVDCYLNKHEATRIGNALHRAAQRIESRRPDEAKETEP